MRTRLIKLLFLISIISLCSCIKSFVPDVGRYNELLVVDGNVNDGPGPYVIKLSTSSKTQERSKVNPFPGCKVQVEDNLGNIFLLTETSTGTYQTDSAAFRAVPGRTYKLHLETPNEDVYESTPEVMPAGLKIQTLTYQREFKTAPDLFYGRDGYQFYVDVETPPTTNNYLFWRMECTFKFQADYQISYYYDNGVHKVLDPDTLRNCYQTKDILDIFILNTNELQQKEIKHFPLHYEDNYTKALSIRYSLKLTQFTINESAFEYWSNVKKIRDAGGELYTQQPFQVGNNLKCLNKPDKPALGYFMVTGISETRIFINPAPFVIREGKCLITDPQMNPLQWFKDRPYLWPVFYADFKGASYVDQECVDCRKTGALKAPPFWKD